MFELIGLGVAAAVGIFGHIRSRKFVGQRLRFTSVIEKPGIGLVAGVIAAILASPFALLPIIGAGTAVAFGVGVGTGVVLGARDAKKPLLGD